MADALVFDSRRGSEFVGGPANSISELGKEVWDGGDRRPGNVSRGGRGLGCIPVRDHTFVGEPHRTVNSRVHGRGRGRRVRPGQHRVNRRSGNSRDQRCDFRSGNRNGSVVEAGAQQRGVLQPENRRIDEHPAAVVGPHPEQRLIGGGTRAACRRDFGDGVDIYVTPAPTSTGVTFQAMRQAAVSPAIAEPVGNARRVATPARGACATRQGFAGERSGWTAGRGSRSGVAYRLGDGRG